MSVVSHTFGEVGNAHGSDDFVSGGGVPAADDGASAGDGVPVVEGGPLSQPQAVSREFIEAELERWSGLLERLGNVDDTV